MNLLSLWCALIIQALVSTSLAQDDATWFTLASGNMLWAKTLFRLYSSTVDQCATECLSMSGRCLSFDYYRLRQICFGHGDGREALDKRNHPHVRKNSAYDFYATSLSLIQQRARLQESSNLRTGLVQNSFATTSTTPASTSTPIIFSRTTTIRSTTTRPTTTRPTTTRSTRRIWSTRTTRSTTARPTTTRSTRRMWKARTRSTTAKPTTTRSTRRMWSTRTTRSTTARPTTTRSTRRMWKTRTRSTTAKPTTTRFTRRIWSTTTTTTTATTRTSAKACERPLGIESGEIQDSAFSASSYYLSFFPYDGRLNGDSTWMVNANDLNQYFEVDLGRDIKLTGIGTQGYYAFFYGSSYVTKYKLVYMNRRTNRQYVSYQDRSGQDKIFDGNTDADTEVVNKFSFQPIRARHLRILPLEWNKNIAMRIELYTSC